MWAAVAWILAIQALVLLFNAVYRHLMKIRFRKAIAENRDREAVSLAWAWLSEQEILAAMQYWGAERLAGMLDHGRPMDSKLFLPHVSVAVFLIILHQLATRYIDRYNKDICGATPNCSNYVIGALRRLGFFLALSKGHVRVASCGTTSAVSFSPDFS